MQFIHFVLELNRLIQSCIKTVPNSIFFLRFFLLQQTKKKSPSTYFPLLYCVFHPFLINHTMFQLLDTIPFVFQVKIKNIRYVNWDLLYNYTLFYSSFLPSLVPYFPNGKYAWYSLNVLGKEWIMIYQEYNTTGHEICLLQNSICLKQEMNSFPSQLILSTFFSTQYSDTSIKNTVLRPNRQFKASTAEVAEYRYS